jgi:hypothetical protein
MNMFDVLSEEVNTITVPRNSFTMATTKDKRSLVFSVVRYLQDNYDNVVMNGKEGLSIDGCRVCVRALDSSLLHIPSWQKGFGRNIDLEAAKESLSKIDFFLLIAAEVCENVIVIRMHTFLPGQIGGEQ